MHVLYADLYLSLLTVPINHNGMSRRIEIR